MELEGNCPIHWGCLEDRGKPEVTGYATLRWVQALARLIPTRSFFPFPSIPLARTIPIHIIVAGIAFPIAIGVPLVIVGNIGAVITRVAK